jgi:hypothetical protein
MHTDFEHSVDFNWFPDGVGKPYDPAKVPCTVMLGCANSVMLKFGLGTWAVEEAWKLVNDFPNYSQLVCVTLEPGDIIIWRGDLYHCGVASKSADFRLLAHVYSPSMRMVLDQLFNVFQQ